MPLIAGPVFQEWYWTPIFLVILLGPPTLLLAGLLYGVAFRRVPGHAKRAGLSLATAVAVVAAGTFIWQHVRFERTEAAQARALGFVVFQARGWDAERTEISETTGEISWTYRRDGTELVAIQGVQPADVPGLQPADIVPPRCGVWSRLSFRGIGGSCELRGDAVLVHDDDGKLFVLTQRGGALVSAYGPGAGEAVLLDYVAALAPVPVEELDFKR